MWTMIFFILKVVVWMEPEPRHTFEMIYIHTSTQIDNLAYQLTHRHTCTSASHHLGYMSGLRERGLGVCHSPTAETMQALASCSPALIQPATQLGATLHSHWVGAPLT